MVYGMCDKGMCDKGVSVGLGTIPSRPAITSYSDAPVSVSVS